MTLPKTKRLKSKKEFAELYSAIRPQVTEYFSVRVSHEAALGYKFAVIVPAKVAPLASVRNTIRRRASAALSRIVKMHTVTPGTHAVFSVRVSGLPETPKLESELLSLMNKSGILHT